MADEQTTTQFLPHALSLPGTPSLFGGKPFSVELSSGVTLLVGPNGAGKTQTLRAIVNALQGGQRITKGGKIVRFLSSGRASPFEVYRAAINTPQGISSGPASVGHQTHRERWWEIESATGDLLALEHRADLRLKVEARLQTLYDRSLKLTWGQSGLRLEFRSLSDGASYYANAEASGLLHLISLLSSLYNDEVGALVIDEPEISLHPQLQAFFLQEAERLAGDPLIDTTKKLVILATHSSHLLPVRNSGDLSKLVFFSDRLNCPTKLSATSPELRDRRLVGLVKRMSETHRTAFFARTILLVEGPSDEMVISGLSTSIGHSLLGGNTQVVPVSGKGAFPDAMKLFMLASKRVVILGDLDSWVDGNALVAAFSATRSGLEAANEIGASSLLTLDNALRTELAKASDASWSNIVPLAGSQTYWTARDEKQSEEQSKRRAICVTLLTHDAPALSALENGAHWVAIKKRLEALFDALERAGCFILRRGTIEEYFLKTTVQENSLGKPDAAAREIEGWQGQTKEDLEARYVEPIRAMRHAAPLPKIDENYLLREKLGAILGAVFQSMRTDMTDAEINARALSTLGPDAAIFKLENISEPSRKRLRVSMASMLFPRPTFPFDLSEHDNLTAVIGTKLV